MHCKSFRDPPPAIITPRHNQEHIRVLNLVYVTLSTRIPPGESAHATDDLYKWPLHGTSTNIVSGMNTH